MLIKFPLHYFLGQENANKPNYTAPLLFSFFCPSFFFFSSFPLPSFPCLLSLRDSQLPTTSTLRRHWTLPEQTRHPPRPPFAGELASNCTHPDLEFFWSVASPHIHKFLASFQAKNMCFLKCFDSWVRIEVLFWRKVMILYDFWKPTWTAVSSQILATSDVTWTNWRLSSSRGS